MQSQSTSTPGRRNNNEGSLFFDAWRKRWVASVGISDGKRRKKSSKTQAEARRNLKEMLLEIGAALPRCTCYECPQHPHGPPPPPAVVRAKPARDAISKKLRLLVLRRDGYHCRLCGQGIEDGVTLHVDHRLPVAAGGKNAMENLWVLCQPCNSGKSAKVFEEMLPTEE